MLVEIKTVYKFRLDTTDGRIPKSEITSTMLTLQELPFLMRPYVIQSSHRPEISDDLNSLKKEYFDILLIAHTEQTHLLENENRLKNIEIISVQIGKFKNEIKSKFGKFAASEATPSMFESKYFAFKNISLGELLKESFDSKITVQVVIGDEGKEKTLNYTMFIEKHRKFTFRKFFGKDDGAKQGYTNEPLNPDSEGAWNESARLSYEFDNDPRIENLDIYIVPDTEDDFYKIVLDEALKCYQSKKCQSYTDNPGDMSSKAIVSADDLWDGKAVQPNSRFYIEGDTFVYIANPIGHLPQPVRIPLVKVSKYIDLRQPQRIESELNKQGLSAKLGFYTFTSIKKDFVSGYTSSCSKKSSLFGYCPPIIAEEPIGIFHMIKVSGLWKMVHNKSIGLIPDVLITCKQAEEYKNRALIEEVCN